MSDAPDRDQALVNAAQDAACALRDALQVAWKAGLEVRVQTEDGRPIGPETIGRFPSVTGTRIIKPTYKKAASA